MKWYLEQDKIYRNQICLSIGPYDSFQLKVHPAFLCVELCTFSGASIHSRSPGSICSEVQRCISSAINEVFETLHFSRKAEFSFGFFCPKNVGIDQSPHPAIVNFLDGQPCNLRCLLTHERLCLPDGSLVWFGEVGAGVILEQYKYGNVTLYYLCAANVGNRLYDLCYLFSIQDSVTPESGVATSATSYSEPCSFIGMNC